MPESAQNVKTADPKREDPKRKRAPTLYLIIAFKLLKGVAALSLAVGVYKLAGKDLSDIFDRVVRFIHLDPENRFLSDIGDKLDEVTPRNVRLVATGTLLYSLIALTQGIGLIFRWPWAYWLTISESAFFIPIEIFELVHRHALAERGLRPHSNFGILSIILGLNIVIVWYLFQNRERLFKHHH
ncbi:MAG TPA: DUF2127 domain-containing protein [Candidatus Angelobacter sp.]|nr:DUF2127 domain-containing protein [Candidatus Angelobacter sp.]